MSIGLGTHTTTNITALRKQLKVREREREREKEKKEMKQNLEQIPLVITLPLSFPDEDVILFWLVIFLPCFFLFLALCFNSKNKRYNTEADTLFYRVEFFGFF